MASIKHFLHPPVGSKALRIDGIGVQEQMRPCIVDRPRGTGNYLFMVFYDDVVIGSHAGRSEHPRTRLIVWRPTDGHYYGNTSRPWNHSWMHCDGTFVSSSIAAERIPVDTPIALRDAAYVDRYLLAVYHEVVSHREPDMVIIRNHVHSWLREIGRDVRGDDAQQGSEIPQNLLDLRLYLDAHYGQALALDALAARAGISVPHLCSQFKRHFGAPVISYVIHRRMREAAYLLHDCNLNVTEIARRVGYDDIFHFSKLFKKHYGRSPRAIRASYAGGR